MTTLIDPAAIDLILAFEGCEKRRPDGTLEAYLCPANVWTIGWGTTGPNIKPGLVISREAADMLLANELKKVVAGVLRNVDPAQRVRLLMAPKKLGALTSFAYNVGVGAFASSTMRRLINRNDYDGAAAQFDRWIFAGGVPLNGLKRRRAAERALFEALE